LLAKMLPRWAAGQMTSREQDEALVTYAPQIHKTDALIDWERDNAEMVCRKARAYDPWPVAYSYIDGSPLRIVSAVPLDLQATAPPGTIVRSDDVRAGFDVVAANGIAGIVMVQAAGGTAMHAVDFLRGHPEIIGKRLTSTARAGSPRHEPDDDRAS
jgi:methionyl-tRNA formyltransferase